MEVNLMREQQELDKEMDQNLIAQLRERLVRARKGRRSCASRCGCSSN